MRDKNHEFAIKMLHHLGYITRSDIAQEFIGFGRSDILGVRGGKAVAVEAKQSAERLVLVSNENEEEGWRYNQQRWAVMAESEPYCLPYWLFITMGKDPVNKDRDKMSPKRSWLVPLSKMLETREALEPYQKSIPYRLSKRSKEKLREIGMEAISYWKDYELVWQKSNSLEKPYWMLNGLEQIAGEGSAVKRYGGFWIPDPNHPFLKSV